MHYSRSLGASLSLHVLVLAIAWGAFNTLKTVPSTEKRVAVSLKTYRPQNASEQPAPAVLTPPVAAQPQPPKPLAVPKVPERPSPVPTKSVVTAAVVAPAVPTPPTPALKAPTPAVAEPVRKEVKAAPPPEKNYEEENLGQIRTILAERLKYPKNALRLKQQGEVKLTFTLHPSKEVSALSVTQSSGFEMLDNAARDLILATAHEFPKPSKPVQITVPIGYKIR